MIDANATIGTHDIVWVTLDTLRYDVAARCIADGTTPFLASVLPGGIWEKRHTPGSFTFAAHAAFFAGFLPTPASPGRHERLFALAFPGSETTGPRTAVFDAATVVAGLANRGYHTLCVGGVGFFNQRTPLGSVLPRLFVESYWRPEMGVTHPRSTEFQVDQALSSAAALPPDRRLFLFLNVSAMHQPNYMYLDRAIEDSPASQAAALSYVDRQLEFLFGGLRHRAPLLVVICSDHGTAYGEDGYHGHRLAHPVVWEVPYAEFILERRG